MVDSKLPTGSAAAELCGILDSPEITALIAEIEATRWTGRPGYRIRSQIGMVLVKHLYDIPVWSRTIRLVREHEALRRAIGCTGSGEPDGVPSEDALRRFRDKLINFPSVRTGCCDQMLSALKEHHPEMGRSIAIDGSLIHAYAKGHERVSRGGRLRRPDEFSDPDASWAMQTANNTGGGGRGYGFKLHMAVDTKTDLPVAWHVSTASGYEPRFVGGLLDETRRRGFTATTAALDRGYDYEAVYSDLEVRDCRPVIPLRQTISVKKGRHHPHECRHGTWVFAGSDNKRKAAKWRCPAGRCEVSSRWIPFSRLHTAIPRTTNRWLKARTSRVSVEREFGRLKNEYGLTPLRVRRLERVKLHADLAILARLSKALAYARRT